MIPITRVRSSCRRPFRAGRRAAFSYRGLLIVLAALVAVPAAGLALRPQFPWSSKDEGPIMYTVERKDYVNEITERGTVESSSNVEIRCEVKSRNMSGTTILYIIPEGTYVTPVPDWKPKTPDEEPPDLLVKLDSSALEREMIQKEGVCANSKSRLIQAQNRYDTALIDKQEYIEGRFKQSKLGIESKIFVAQEELRKAEDSLKFDREQLAMGYVSELQVQADEFAVEKAKRALEEAQLDLHVLENYTYEKECKRLDSDIEIAKAELDTAKRTYDLDLEELEDVKTQMANCTIRAPEAGQVVYANVVDRRGGREIIIEEGTQVRERQEIIRLPDPKRMQVKATVNEAKVSLVASGQPVRLRLDAFPDLDIGGTVERVNDYPEPSSWFTGNVKEYQTIIRIHNPPEGSRPGLTAEVKIRVDEQEKVLQVPVQTILGHGGKNYCVVRDGDGDGFKAKPVKIRSTNDKVVVLEEDKEDPEWEGLKEGDQVVLNANAFRNKLDLPELPPETLLAKRQPASPVDAEQGTQPTAEQPADSGRPTEMTAAQRVDRMLERFDSNGNGQLDQDELPEQMRALVARVDTNGDQALDRQELITGLPQFPAGRSFGGRRPRGDAAEAGGPEGGERGLGGSGGRGFGGGDPAGRPPGPRGVMREMGAEPGGPGGGGRGPRGPGGGPGGRGPGGGGGGGRGPAGGGPRAGS